MPARQGALRQLRVAGGGDRWLPSGQGRGLPTPAWAPAAPPGAPRSRRGLPSLSRGLDGRIIPMSPRGWRAPLSGGGGGTCPAARGAAGQAEAGLEIPGEAAGGLPQGKEALPTAALPLHRRERACRPSVGRTRRPTQGCYAAGLRGQLRGAGRALCKSQEAGDCSDLTGKRSLMPRLVP